MCLICDTTKDCMKEICDACTASGYTNCGLQFNGEPIPLKKFKCTCEVTTVLPGFCQACDFKIRKSCKLHYYQTNCDLKHEDYCKRSKE